MVTLQLSRLVSGSSRFLVFRVGGPAQGALFCTYVEFMGQDLQVHRRPSVARFPAVDVGSRSQHGGHICRLLHSSDH